MDSVFTDNVPDLTSWGQHTRTTPAAPRSHTVDLLDITITNTASSYGQTVHDLARVIASSRLQPDDLDRWENTVSGVGKMRRVRREPVARALARGIVRSGSNPVTAAPPWNAKNFKGHVVEVVLYCIRVHLGRTGLARPVLFQPRKPKAASASPGIDLLEIGSLDQGFYFHVWECKGTKTAVSSSFNEAAGQLCAADGTAYQSFMEAHRALQDSPEIEDVPGLAAFVRDMPRMFYGTPAASEKRLGGAVGCDGGGNSAHTTYFAAAVAENAHRGQQNCHAVIVRFAAFSVLLTDVYQRLWSIY